MAIRLHNCPPDEGEPYQSHLIGMNLQSKKETIFVTMLQSLLMVLNNSLNQQLSQEVAS
jgi:hypothetical protein